MTPTSRSLWSGALSAVRLMSGIVRVKLIALAIGVTGVGIYSLIVQGVLTMVAIASMNLATPIIILGRPKAAAGEFRQAGATTGTALAIVLFNIALLFLVGLVVGRQQVATMTKSGVTDLLVIFLLLSCAFSSISNSFGEGLSFQADRFDIYAKSGIAGALADALFITTGAFAYGLKGALIALPFGPLFGLLTYLILLKRDSTASEVMKSLGFRIAELPRLLQYSFLMFAAVGSTNAALTMSRARVLSEAGAAANGNLQTATSLSAYVLAFVTTGFWGRMYSRAAAEGDTAAVRNELSRVLERGLLISFTGCGVAAVLPGFLLPLFYSRQFTGAAPLVTAYMPGELCFQFLTLLISYQLTVNLRQRYLAWSLGYAGLLLVIATILVPRYGAAGYVAGHVAAALLMVVSASYLCWSRGQISGSILLYAAGLVGVLALTSASLLFAADRTSPWRLLALIPYLVSGCIVSWQMLHGFGLGRRSSTA